MKVDLQLDVAPSETSARAVELVACGADGLFTFEGAHDAFLPLALAANAVRADLMTNVAIAMPRSPLHLAHTAYDLQLLSGGRFRLGLGSQTRPHIEKRYGGEWSRPAARMREAVAAEVADGLLVMPFNSARHFQERIRPAIAEGLERAGREPADLAIYPQVVVAMGRTPAELDAAADGARRLLAFYGSTPAYRPVLEVEGTHVRDLITALKGKS